MMDLWSFDLGCPPLLTVAMEDWNILKILDFKRKRSIRCNTCHTKGNFKAVGVGAVQTTTDR
jgi:hypothetical protein